MAKGVIISLLVLLSFFLFTAPVAHLKTPGFKPVDPGQLPDNYPVAVTWTGAEGQVQCRGFWAGQLAGLEYAFKSYSLTLTPDLQTVCQASVETLEQTGRWPLMLKGERPTNWPYAHIKIDPDSGAIGVSYTHDDDLHNESRYRVDNGIIIAAEQRLYSGPGLALRAMPYGLVITLVFWLIIKILYRRFMSMRAAKKA